MYSIWFEWLVDNIKSIASLCRYVFAFLQINRSRLNIAKDCKKWNVLSWCSKQFQTISWSVSSGWMIPMIYKLYWRHKDCKSLYKITDSKIGIKQTCIHLQSSICLLGPLLLTWTKSQPAYILTSLMKCGVDLIVRSQTSILHPLKFARG